MLAADVTPNRLQRAKLAILDFMRRHTHSRLGLVAFAGQAFEAAKQMGAMQGRQTDLNTVLSGGVVVTTSMIDRQVALATAHTAVAAAQQVRRARRKLISGDQ